MLLSTSMLREFSILNVFLSVEKMRVGWNLSGCRLRRGGLVGLVLPTH